MERKSWRKAMKEEEIEASSEIADNFFDELVDSDTNPGPAVFSLFVNSILFLGGTRFTREELHTEIDSYLEEG